MTYLPTPKWLCFILFSLAMHTYSINGQTNFAPSKPFFSPISATPSLVDLDNDSYVDLVYCSNNFYWQRNSGASSFLLSQTILTNINSKLSVIADMDNDGDLDLVFNRVTNPSVFLLSKNNGNSEFSIPQIILTLDDSINIQEVWAVDIDNDSYKDIVLIRGEYWQTGVVWYKNDGIGNCSFETVLAEDIDYYPRKVLFMDTDYDGDIDFLAKESSTIVRYENNGAGVFQSVNTGLPPVLSFNVGNWDNDGHDDLILARSWQEWNSQTNSLDYPYSIIVYPSNDNGVPNQEPIGTPGWGPLYPYVATGDFDGDGVRDLLFGISSIPSYHEGYYSLLLSNENGTQTVISYMHEGESPYIAAFDIDNDGQTEILHSTPSGLLLWLDLNEDSTINTHVIFDEHPIITHFEDIDNDGYRDFVGLTNPHMGWGPELYPQQVLYIKNNEQNTTNQQVILPIYADKVYPADFNGDNLVDLLTQKQFEYTVYLNNGNGDFVLYGDVINADYSTILYVGDTDQDLDIDIVLSTYDNAHAYVNNGTGDLEIFTSYIGGYPQTMADIDNDALPDLLVVYDNPKRLAWLKNYGNNSFGPSTTIADLSNTPEQVSVADMNNDSANDIVVVSNGELLWYPNNGNNTFGAGQIIGNTINAHLLIADIDQNGYKDVINYSAEIWFNQGNEEFSEMSIGYYSKVNFIADLDNDTDIDIIGDTHWVENLLFHNSLQGICFYDTNQDGQYNAGDFPLQNANIWLNPSVTYSVLGQDSYFYIPIPSNNYTISASIDSGDWQCTTDSLVYTVTAGNQVTNINFGFYPLNQVSDIAPYLSSHVNNCDPIIPYYLTLYNQGTSIDSMCILSCSLDSRLILQYAEPAPDSIGANNTAYWHSYQLLPTYRQNITLWLQNNANAGDTLSLTATASTYNHQLEMVSNHSYHYEPIIKCGAALNDLQSDPLGVRYPNYRLIDETNVLYYTVYFENTNEDTIHNLRINAYPRFHFMNYTTTPTYTEDISLINSSHIVQKICNDEDPNVPLSFYFKDINLPSRTVDPVNSKGFLIYALRLPENITSFTVALNTAYLYFDENDIITSRTTICTLVDEIPTGVTTIQNEKTLKVYPNPAQDYIVVENNSLEKRATFVLYDVMGRQVLSLICPNQSVIPVEQLPSSVYLYQLLNPQNQILQQGKVSIMR